jgi:NAD+ diphosphatase
MMELDRAFNPGIKPPQENSNPAWWFAFQGVKLLIEPNGSGATIPFVPDFKDFRLTVVRRHFLGHLEDHPCYAAELAEGLTLPEGLALEGLRQVYGRLDEGLFWLAARAIQIVDWDRTHQFCSRCGTPTVQREIERSKECPKCGQIHFPRLAPAVIVLVERGNQLLMARSRHFAPGIFSVLAGFVEPGETLEEAVAREVKEESGILVKDIRYFGSQPWPFPHSLMIGFTAKYAGGEITLEDSELEAAGWYTIDNLPPQPGKISIARKLIDAFVEKQKRNHADLKVEG